MRVAARLAYWGPAYHGYARQPDVDTVEGDLVQALQRIRAIRDLTSARLAVASRTDRGVSATGNVVAFDSALSFAKLPRATAGKMHDAWLWAALPVDEGFNPRRARSRRYRYHFSGDVPVAKLRAAANLFRGEHDFSSFTVGRVGGYLKVDRIAISRDSPFTIVDFVSHHFARGLVRRIAGAMEAHARGEATTAELLEALRGAPIQTPPATPERLFLLDVDCGLAWPPARDRIADAIRVRLDATALAHRFADQLTRVSIEDTNRASPIESRDWMTR